MQGVVLIHPCPHDQNLGVQQVVERAGVRVDLAVEFTGEAFNEFGKGFVGDAPAGAIFGGHKVIGFGGTEVDGTHRPTIHPGAKGLLQIGDPRRTDEAPRRRRSDRQPDHRRAALQKAVRSAQRGGLRSEDLGASHALSSTPVEKAMSEFSHKITPRCWLAEAAIVILALIAFRKGNPYSFYIFLRWAACPLFGWIAWKTYSKPSGTALVVVSASLAILYNPLVRVGMTRDNWELVNIVMIVIAIWSALFSVKGARQ